MAADREAFERCIVKEDTGGIDLHYNQMRNSYLYHTTQIAWLAWQAACKYKDEQREDAEYFNEARESIK